MALHYSSWLYITLPWLYFTLLYSIMALLHSTWLYITLLVYFTVHYSTLALLHFTSFHIILAWLYLTLLVSALLYYGSTWLDPWYLSTRTLLNSLHFILHYSTMAHFALYLTLHYTTLVLLDSTSLYVIVQWLYFTVLHSTKFYHGSTWFYFTTPCYRALFDCTFTTLFYTKAVLDSVATMALFQSTWVLHLQCFYVILLDPTKHYHGVKHQEVLSGLEEKAKRLDIHMHFCAFSQHSFFFLSTWSVIRQSYIGTLFRIQLLFEGWWLNNTRICVCKITFMNCLLSWEDSLHRPNFAFVNVYVTQSC